VLIYNHNKEFVGIDAEDLDNLGYKSLSSFLDDYNDFADLFVKKPGFIHNFKNFPWIDFVLHAEADESKAIIKSEHREFTCDLVITPFFLADSSDQESYAITLKHIRDSSGNSATIESTHSNEKIVMDMDDDFDIGALSSQSETVLNEPDLLDIPDFEMTPAGAAYDDTDLAFPDLDDTFGVLEKSKEEERPMLGDTLNQDEAAYLDNLSTPKDYVFNPQVASDELGLPVDLIEEFIGDFIQQSHEFKDKLFDVTLKEDYDEVHALSHKLKGVAANLRIEDSFEVLSVINNSTDQTEIEANLKQFYRLIAKLEGKEAPEFEVAEKSYTAADTNQADELLDFDDDIYDFDLLLDDEPKQMEPVIIEENTIPDMAEHFDIPEEEPAPSGTGSAMPDDDFMFDLEPEPKPEPEPQTLQTSKPALDYDMKSASDQLGLKHDFVAELVHEFATEAKEMHSQFNNALKNNDHVTIKNMAIELKGASDNLRITKISVLLQNLTHSDDPAAGKQTINELYDLIDQL